MSRNDMIEIIMLAIKDPALLEQLAEECAELGKAALKLARILRGENPTPVNWADAEQAVYEECVDVSLCIDLVKRFTLLTDDVDYAFRKYKKLERWAERIKEKEASK